MDHRVNPQCTFEADAEISAPATSAPDGKIVVGDEKGHIYALSPDGNLLWNNQLENSILRSAPVVDSRATISLATHGGELVAMEPNGNRRWTRTIASDIQTSPVIAPSGILLAGTYDSRLYAFDIGAPGANLR